MISGYYEFPDDVQSVFADTIRQFGFENIKSEFDAVMLKNDKVQIGFSINEDVLNMSIKSGGKFYNVIDVLMLMDKDYYFKWNMERKAGYSGSSQEAYFKNYLSYYHILSDKYFLNSYATGTIPFKNEYDKMKEERDVYEKKFSLAWNEMQKLDYEHPIRQKYIFNDPSWIDDAITLIENK